MPGSWMLAPMAAVVLLWGPSLAGTRPPEAPATVAAAGDPLGPAHQGPPGDLPAISEALAGYTSRALLRVGDVRYYWRRPEDEIFATLIPPRLVEAQADISALLGGESAPPRHIVMAADAGDLARVLRSLKGGEASPALEAPGGEERLRALGRGMGSEVQSGSAPGWVILLSPAAATSAPQGMSWRENLRHELSHHALASRSAGGAGAPESPSQPPALPAQPAWLSEAVAAQIDGRFESPLGRVWALPSRQRVELFFAAPPAALEPGATSAADAAHARVQPVDIVSAYLTLRGLLRAQGQEGLQVLLRQGGRARSSETLPGLLRREWRRERRERSFTGGSTGTKRSPELLRLRRLARLLVHAGQHAAAAVELRRAFDQSGDAEIGLRLLPLDIQNGDWESAGKLCRALPRRQADGFLYRFLCGQLYVVRQEYPRAIEALQGAVDVEPYNVDAHGALRDVYDRLKRSREKLDETVILRTLKLLETPATPGDPKTPERREEAP